MRLTRAIVLGGSQFSVCDQHCPPAVCLGNRLSFFFLQNVFILSNGLPRSEMARPKCVGFTTASVVFAVRLCSSLVPRWLA